MRAVIRVPYTPEGDAGRSGRAGPGFRSPSVEQQHQLMSKVPSLMFDMEDTEDAAPASAARRPS